MLDPSCDEPEISLSDDDVYEAMKSIPGYVDITPADFREIYLLAFRHACRRVTASIVARDIMTAPVITVHEETPLSDVANLMARNGISGLPVLSTGGAVTGVISEKDFLHRLGTGTVGTFMGIVSECLSGEGCIAVAIRAQRAQDIMTSPAVTVTQHATLAQISDVFTRENINRAPVLDDNGYLCGIVTRADIIRGSLLAQGRRP